MDCRLQLFLFASDHSNSIFAFFVAFCLSFFMWRIDYLIIRNRKMEESSVKLKRKL